MFLAAPAGLNLYWLASNLCSIVQQGVTMRMLGARDGAAAKEARPVKDRVFSGRDVPRTRSRAAAEASGCRRPRLRYVVLDAGRAGRSRGDAEPGPDRRAAGRRLSRRAATPAAPRGGERRRRRRPKSAESSARSRRGGRPRRRRWSSRSARGRRRSALDGPDAAFFLGADGQGEVLRALEHLLQRVFATAGGRAAPARGVRGASGSAATSASRRRRSALAAAVREDGVARGPRAP